MAAARLLRADREVNGCPPPGGTRGRTVVSATGTATPGPTSSRRQRAPGVGAARTVTGSKFLLEANGSRLLVDCGLFQGLGELRRRNWSTFPVDPATIDAVVLTHAHVDHCGYLPALVRDGFAGPIVTTRWTSELARIVLQDAAHSAGAGETSPAPSVPVR